jgi:hypothetical protein
MTAQKHRFCSVYVFSKRLYVSREEGVRGPRRAVFPPTEFARTIDGESLGREIRDALRAYHETGELVEATQWEIFNRQLLDFHGAKSVAAFERGKRGVTIREDVATGEIRFFTPAESKTVLDKPSDSVLGSAVSRLLDL